MGELYGGVWGQSPQLIKANGGLGANPPAAKGTNYITPLPELKNLKIFFKNNLILGLFW